MKTARVIDALSEGLASVRRNPGLVALLLVLNLAMAALLAVPFAASLEKSLKNTGSAETMLRGFDYPWWTHFADSHTGFAAAFRPDIFGHGFALKNTSLLLNGELPGGLFRPKPEKDAPENGEPGLDGVVLGLGVAYLLLQVFLAGGIYATLRRPKAQWTMRGLIHASGFYFGRFVRISLVALLLDYFLFALNGPLSRFADEAAREAVSERTALYWLFGRHLLLLLAILFVHLVAGYAKAITVLEERSSALLAWASAGSFVFFRFGRVVAHYASIVLLSVALLAVWRFLDSQWPVSGYKTQVVAFALAQLLVFGRIALRVALASGQLALYRDRG